MYNKQIIKKKPLIFALMAILATIMLSSCKKENMPKQESSNVVYRSNDDEARDFTSDTTNEVMPPILCSNLPTFYVEVLYVVAKEYETVEDGTSTKTTYNGRQITSYSKAEYMESRLIDLYPEEAYVGLADESRVFYDSVVAVYNSYPYVEVIEDADANGRDCFAFAEDKDEELEYVSDENEIEILNMTEDEIAWIISMNELARMKRFANLDDILKINKSKESKEVPLLNGPALRMVMIVYGAYVFERTWISAKRAIDKSKEFYGDYLPGQKGDAFKHIFVNVMLRRYLSRPMAYFIMDVIYENIPPINQPCDRYMDWHNNYVGRVTKYSDFRKTDNWETWATKVRNFINNSITGEKKNGIRLRLKIL